MNSPFFTNRRWFEQPDPNHRPFRHSARDVPVYHADPYPESHRPVLRATERASAPKIVRIPVQFFGSEQLDRTGSAVKIQKVFRGFLVRKSLRRIKGIKLQVDEIEERLKRSEVLDFVRDSKERLRLNESLMALLLKLDSICGVDFGVRGCRKAVIRKAIALQERIDAIVTSDSGVGRNGEIVDFESESNVTSDVENSVPPVNLKDSCEDEGHSKDSIDDREAPEVVSCGRGMEVEGGDDAGDDEAGIVDVGVDCEVKVGETSENLETVKGNDSMTNRELLEKMMQENEKMMSMMSQLFEKTEMQTRMLNGLTHRVELLEKAVVCDRLRKKKKKAKPSEN